MHEVRHDAALRRHCRRAPLQHANAAGAAVVIDIDPALACWHRLDAATVSDLVFLFHEWEPAIRIGIHAYLAWPDDDFDAIAPTLAAAYQRIHGRSRVPWPQAAATARRVWQTLQDNESQNSRLHGRPQDRRRHDGATAVDVCGRHDSEIVCRAGGLAPLGERERLLLAEA